MTQGWGSAHIAGLLHQVRQSDGAFTGANATINSWGWGVLGGVSFNLPSLGAGADVKLQAQYTDGAIGYTHLFGIGAFNFSGVTYDGATSDAYYDLQSGSWTKPTAWGVAAVVDLPIGPTFKVSPEISYGQIKLSDTGSRAQQTFDTFTGGWYYNSSLSPQVDLWVGGATFEWDPVKNFAFDLDLLYAYGHQDAPTGWGGHYTAATGGTEHMWSGASAWKTDFEGFNGKLRITRNF